MTALAAFSNLKVPLFAWFLLVTYECTDDAGVKTKVSEYKDPARFNTSVTEWQYASSPFVLQYSEPEDGYTYTPIYIKIVPRYCEQVNHVYFDNIMLAKEPAQTYAYDDDGNLVAVSANSEQSTNAVYNEKTNDLTSYTDTLGNTTTMRYDNKHNLTHSTSEKGVTSSAAYNTNGTVSVSEVRNTLTHDDASMAIRTNSTYHTGGEDYGINDGAYLKYSYDEHGNATYYTCNWATGAPKTVTDANGTVTTKNYYDDNGDDKVDYNKLKSVTSVNSTVSYTYEENSNQLKGILFTGTESDSPLEKYLLEYDEYGNRISTSVGSQPLSTNYYENHNGVLYLTEYGNGDTIDYTYTKLGSPSTRVKTGDSTTTYKWSYDAAGAVLAHTDSATGYKYTYSYDSLGRLVRQNVVSYAGETKGTPISFTENVYDKRNNLTELINNVGGRTITQQYLYSEYSKKDSNGKAITNDSAKYAKDNLPTLYQISSKRYAYYDYDSINRLNKRTLTTADTIYNNYIYYLSERNAEGSTFYRTNQLKTEIIDDVAYRYIYDAVGNITAVLKGARTTKNSDTIETDNFSAYRSYEYDDLYQLTRENNASADQSKVWEYDDLGNIDSVTTYSYTTGSPSQKKSYIDYVYSDDDKNGWDYLLTELKYTTYTTENGKTTETNETKTITYDSIGNPTSYLGNTLKWTGRELYRYQNDSIQNNYYYDSEGLRSRKNIYTKNESGSFEYAGKTMYQYLGGLLSYQCTYNAKGEAEQELYFYYDSYNKLTAIRYISSLGDYYYYVTTNMQGDVLGIYNADGELKVSYEYDAWGNVLSVKDASDKAITSPNHIGNINPIRYRGYYYDSEIGLYYLQSRYYDPEIGRFLNADGYITTGQGVLSFNMFAYCMNNPVRYSDYTGCASIFAVFKKIVNNATAIIKSNSIKTFFVDLLERITSPKAQGNTCSIGYTYGYTSGGVSGNKSKTISSDTSYNYAIQETESSGAGTGVGGSFGLTFSFTNANNVNDLNGESRSWGGAFAGPIGISVEYTEFVPASNPQGKCCGFGFAISVGGEAEIHEYTNETEMIEFYQPLVSLKEKLYG